MKKIITIAILITIYSPFITYGQKMLEHTIIFDVNRWKIEEKKEGNFRPILSFGTNIIYDLLLMPTILIEYLPEFSHFSIMGEATFPWYKQEKHHQYFQLQRYSLFVKYHPLTKGCYNRWFIAPYVETGLYDLEEKLGWFNFSHPNKEGYQGEFWGAGISAGFSMPFAKNRAKIEFRAGFGYIQTKYRTYVSFMETYPYIQSKKLNYFGPTQLSISIHWNILNRKY